MRIALTIVIVVLVTACGNSSKPLITHGVNQLDNRTAFWVAINSQIKFLFAFDSAEVTLINENHDGSEFTIYYELESSEGRSRLMVYGDDIQGIISAAYDNEALDLIQGEFLAEVDGKVEKMQDTEKYAFYDVIDTSVSSTLESLQASRPVMNPAMLNEEADAELQLMTPEDMEAFQEERQELINRGSPLGEEVDEVEAIRQKNRFAQ